MLAISIKMTKLKLQYTYILLVLLLFGCGNTPINPANTPEVINKNSITRITDEFRLTKLQSAADFDGLPKELGNYKTEIEQFDFYFAQSPTQSSGGFIFEAVEKKGLLLICLKRPAPFAIVGAVLSNPIALIKVTKGLNVKMDLSFCER
jgi:hypothetical protein